jgi:hypothetical protein
MVFSTEQTEFVSFAKEIHRQVNGAQETFCQFFCADVFLRGAVDTA